MKLTVGQLRALFKQGLEEGRIGASQDYMKKDRVREELQNLVAAAVAAGEITDQQSLEQFLSDINTSMTALKMIPFEVWGKLASKK